MRFEHRTTCEEQPPTDKDETRIRPSAWSGEAGWDVGPFCCEDTARRFANPPVDFGAYESLELHPANRSGIWYVRVLDRVEGRRDSHVTT